ncbi:NAD-dependent formate dehydrogenase alpha subunit [Hydrogenimonas sp.]|nr:NAD-dependent formate dehydrogenase alpha subunit [Hydrogenimonas sp.]
MKYEEIESVCTYCGVGCDIVAEVDGNEIHKIRADKDGYVSQGKLCVKGKYGFGFVNSPERVREPRIARRFLEKNPDIAEKIGGSLRPLDDDWFTTDLDNAVKAAAMKLTAVRETYGDESFCAIGGARSSCESAYMFQKFTRDAMNSPHVDNCARVCHSPSLKGMRATIGEGAATNPYNDIYEAEFILIIGSNTTEAHPIVANRIIDAARLHDNVAVMDVREIKMMKYAKHKAVIPYESNLLVLNMMAHVILKEELYNRKFVESRTSGFEEFKESILADPYTDPEFFRTVPGYEHLATLIPVIAREYALKKSMIFWGLGVTEHLDGSYAVMAITHLALLTGNVGKSGAGLMPLRGQNNVQGACDMGCLPYFAPDYQKPEKEGLMTPQLIDAMLEGEIKALLNMGEDVAHIHPNQNKIERALERLEFIMVQELFMTEIAKRADIVIGVKSAYEKEGVYINAMRRLHLSQPIVQSDLPDDWEVLVKLENEMRGSYRYSSGEDIWNEVREVAHRRFSQATYLRLKRHRKRGLQWPVYTEDTPVLHLLDFRTDDGLGKFIYHGYRERGMVKELRSTGMGSGFYLTTGRTLAQYNNAAQTHRCEKLESRYGEDILLASEDDAKRLPGSEYVVLKSEYGESAPLRLKLTGKIKPGTLFVTFHHAKSKINYLFGDESDELILTAAFKSVKVEVLPA